VTLTAAVLGASLVLALLCYALPAELGVAIVREGGLIELPTALAFVGAGGVAFWVSVRDRWRSGWAVGLLLAAAAAREMDFHRRFTTVSIEKGTYLGFFGAREVPWPEKLVVGVVLAGLGAAALALVVREHRPFLTALGARRTEAVAALGGFAALAVAQSFDKASGRVGRALPGVVLLAKCFEEHLELAGAVLFLLAVLLIARRT
jgi:hypothetical protein